MEHNVATVAGRGRWSERVGMRLEGAADWERREVVARPEYPALVGVGISPWWSYRGRSIRSLRSRPAGLVLDCR